MNHSLFHQHLLRNPLPWWLPILSLAITIYGILFLNWQVFPVIFFFWWEVILMVGAALIRMFFSLDGGSFFKNLLFRVFLLGSGTVLGGALIVFTILFSVDGIETESDWGTGYLAGIKTQVNIMTGGTLLGLVLHFFANGRYRRSNPFAVLMASFAQVLIMLAILQVFTMHLIPNYPGLGQARWVAVAVVAVKFGVDLLFLKFGSFIRLFAQQ
jgi:hypothetical protein